MNRLFTHVLTAVMLLSPLAGAVQLSDLSADLTRTGADETLTKDYAYRVLSDLTVRRIWNLDENRKLTIDFDPGKDKLICIMVDYKKPVSAKQGTEAVKAIAHTDEVKWNKLDTKQASKYGVENARALKIDKSYLFMETNAAGKCVRVMLFTSVPKQNRRHLSDISTTGYGPTAMGNNTQASAGKALLEDEKKRLATPNKTDLAKEETKESDTMEDDKTEPEETPTEEVTETPKEVAAAEPTPEPQQTTPKKVKKAKASTAKNRYEAFMAKLGLEGVTPVQLGLGGAGIILLFTIIGMIKRNNEAKLLAAKARAMAESDPGETLRARSGVKRPKLKR